MVVNSTLCRGKEQQQHTSLEKEVNVDAMLGDGTNQSLHQLHGQDSLLRRIMHVREPSDKRGKERRDWRNEGKEQVERSVV